MIKDAVDYNSDCYVNWPTPIKETLDLISDLIRKELECCDSPQGCFFITSQEEGFVNSFAMHNDYIKNDSLPLFIYNNFPGKY